MNIELSFFSLKFKRSLNLNTVLMKVLLDFFFSSRRRHTRSLRDWSSDVCSSDLKTQLRSFRRRNTFAILSSLDFALWDGVDRHAGCACVKPSTGTALCRSGQQSEPMEIGRASCRERGQIWVPPRPREQNNSDKRA